MNNLSGQRIKGYELQERIAAGGFGAVYRAKQSTVGREVAIKVILPGLANQPDFIRRFEAEAQLIARLEHHFIVPLYDYWRDPNGAYLVMRYLRGGSLRDYIRKQGALSIEDAFTLFSHVAQGLYVAHRKQVIHRDIKPGNVLLDEDGTGFLADFGIAKDYTTLHNITEPDSLIGSPEYLAPEQARSESVTPQTDIYSLGVVLYEILTGKHPFLGQEKIELIFKHLNDPLPDITTLDDHICHDVNDVIQKATAKNPKQRFADVIEMMEALRQAAQLDTVATPQSPVELLTPREQEVMQLIIEGKTNREIAQLLVLTEGTIKTYITRIYRKLNVRSRVQAIARARDLDFVIQKPEAKESNDTGFLPAPDNPYKGLRAFQAADAQDFYGREKLIQKLVSRLKESGDYHRFLSVVGPSGSGKSSVVKAGLIPALWRGDIPGSENWYVVEPLPGTRPIDELEVALFQVATDKSINLREQLQRDQYGLIRVADMILPDDGSELLIVIDQFEEVFTLLDSEDERIHFLNLIREAVTDIRSRVRIVITLRADYYDRPLQYPEFGKIIRHRVETVLPLGAEELEWAISEPANRVGVTFENGLVSRIVSDVHYQPGSLPLLQYALTELFENRKKHLLTVKAYQAIGGAGGALSSRADEIYLEGNDEDRELVRQLFLRLVTLGEGAEDTRRRVTQAEILSLAENTERMEEMIDKFAVYRLLSLDHDPKSHQPTVEVAHEAILREWKRLRKWINEVRYDIKLQQQLSRMMEDWQRAGQDTSYLVTGTRLEKITEWANNTPLIITHDEQEFLTASLRKREQDRKMQDDRDKWEKFLRRSLVGVMLIATVISIGLSIVALSERNSAIIAQLNAERRADELQSLNLTNSARQMVDEDMQLALRLGLESTRIENPPLQSQQVLFELAAMPGPSQLFHGHTAEIHALDYSSDGKYILSGDRAQNLILWDAQSGDELRRLSGHTREINAVDISSDSSLALSGSADRRIILWDLSTGSFVREFIGHNRDVSDVIFSPDGLTFFSSSVDQSIIQWDLQTGAVINRLEGHLDEVMDIDLSPDGTALVSGSADGVSIVWDVKSGTRIREFESNLGITRAVALSPSGQNVAMGSGNTIIIWDIQTSEKRKTLVSDYQVWSLEYDPGGKRLLSVPWDMTGFEGPVTLWDIYSGQVEAYLHSGTFDTAATFSPDGTELVSASANHTLIKWDLVPFNPVQVFDEYKNGALSVAVSSDATQILSGGGQGGLAGGYLKDTSESQFIDSRVILWDIATAEIRQQLHGHQGSVWDVAFSPDMKTAASGGSDKTIIVWDLETGQIIHQLQAHTGIVFSIAYSTDGLRLISGSEDSSVILWDMQNGEAIQRYDGHEFPVYSVKFSQEDQSIISMSNDGNIVVWDVETGSQLRELQSSGNMPRALTLLEDRDILISSGYMESDPLQFWNLETGEKFRELGFHANGIDVSPNESLFALTQRNGGTFTVLDISTGKVLQNTKAHHDIVWDVEFTPDSLFLLTASGDGTIKLWPTSSESIKNYIMENRVIPPLTAEQRLRFEVAG